jgi:fructosamine-3-kinase
MQLYNLYHLLNHLNMFGDAYLRQSSAIVDQLLAEQGG